MRGVQRGNAKLDALDTKLADMAEVLVSWLDENAYTALQIYFLCGVLRALIETGWDDDVPPLYADLLAVIDRVGTLVGPMIAAIELQQEPVIVKVDAVCERPRKTPKKAGALMAILMVQPIPERFKAKCEFCPDDLDVCDLGVYQYTSGWVMNRAGGGGHGVSLAQRQPRWAHGLCIERKSNGTFGQTAMF